MSMILGKQYVYLRRKEKLSICSNKMKSNQFWLGLGAWKESPRMVALIKRREA